MQAEVLETRVVDGATVRVARGEAGGSYVYSDDPGGLFLFYQDGKPVDWVEVAGWIDLLRTLNAIPKDERIDALVALRRDMPPAEAAKLIRESRQ